MHLFLALLIGCGAPTDNALRSQPTEPTVELDTKREESVTWKTLEGLFTKAPATFPTVVQALKLGQKEADARAVLESVRHPKMLVPDDQRFDDLLVTSAPLEAFPAVGVTLVIRDGLLYQVDVGLPADEALFALNESWGAPSRHEPAANSAVPVPVWLADGMSASLFHTDKPVAILKFSAVE